MSNATSQREGCIIISWILNVLCSTLVRKRPRYHSVKVGAYVCFHDGYLAAVIWDKASEVREVWQRDVERGGWSRGMTSSQSGYFQFRPNSLRDDELRYRCGQLAYVRTNVASLSSERTIGENRPRWRQQPLPPTRCCCCCKALQPQLTTTQRAELPSQPTRRLGDVRLGPKTINR